MTNTYTETFQKIHDYREYVLMAMIATCLCLVAAYAVNVVTLISRTVATQKIESQISSLSLATNALDGQYLEAVSGITPDLVPAYGLMQGQVSEYISRSATLGRVAFSGHEF